MNLLVRLCFAVFFMVVSVAGLDGVRAEVSTDTHNQLTQTLVLGHSVEDPDPISILWQPFRELEPGKLLNPSGYGGGDGRPDIDFKIISEDPDPIAYWPIVVWAANAGADHDVAISEWDGTAWTQMTFLTATLEDERDPRVFVEPGGRVHVVWWTGGSPARVYVVTREAESSVWTPPLLVSGAGESAWRPSVAVFEGAMRVAYERASTQPGSSREVVVVQRELDLSFTVEVLLPTSRDDRLDPVLHVAAGHVWVDWKNGGAEFGAAELLEQGWTMRPAVPWTDASWVGEEMARHAVHRHVLAP